MPYKEVEQPQCVAWNGPTWRSGAATNGSELKSAAFQRPLDCRVRGAVVDIQIICAHYGRLIGESGYKTDETLSVHDDCMLSVAHETALKPSTLSASPDAMNNTNWTGIEMRMREPIFSSQSSGSNVTSMNDPICSAFVAYM